MKGLACFLLLFVSALADKCNSALGLDLASLPNVQTQLGDRMIEATTGSALSSFNKSDEGNNDLTIHSLALDTLQLHNSSNLVRYRNDMFYLNYTNVTLDYATDFTLLSQPGKYLTRLCGYFLLWGKLDLYQGEHFFNIQFSRTQLGLCQPTPNPKVAEVVTENGFQDEFIEHLETQMGNVSHYSLQNLVQFYLSNLVEVYPGVHLLALQEGDISIRESRLHSQYRTYLVQGPDDLGMDDSRVAAVLETTGLTVSALAPNWTHIQDQILLSADLTFLNTQLAAVLFSRSAFGLSFHHNLLLQSFKINGQSLATLMTVQQLKTLFPFIDYKETQETLKVSVDLEKKPEFAFLQLPGEQRVVMTVTLLADFRPARKDGSLAATLVMLLGTLRLELTPVYSDQTLSVQLHDVSLSHLKYAKAFQHLVLQQDLQSLRRYTNVLLLSAQRDVQNYLQLAFSPQSLLQGLFYEKSFSLLSRDGFVTLQGVSRSDYNHTELAEVYTS